MMTKFSCRWSKYFIVCIFVADAASTAHADTAVLAEAEIDSSDGSTTTVVNNNNKNGNSSWNSLMKQIFGGGGEKDGGGSTSSSSSPSDSNDDGSIFESIGEAVVPTHTHTEECRSQDGEQNECSSSDQKQHNEELAENAESIWKFLGIAAGKKEDDQPKGQKTTKETESAVEQEEESTTMDAWQSVLLQARKYHAERQKTGDSTPFEEKVHAVYNVFTRIVEQFKNQFGKLQLEKFNFMQLWYVLQNEERLKDPVYKRQQHRFFDPISEDQALELADALYLNGVAYSDSCEEIEYYLSLFHNNEWFMVNCTTESTPEHPAHYLAVKRQEVAVADGGGEDDKDVNDWTKWFQQQRLLKQQDKDSTMEVLFVVRATKNEMDILTDALLEATPYRGGYSHQGLLKSALWLYEEYKHWLPQLLDASGNTKMELYTVGYSLGAGAAALLTMEINENEEFDSRIKSKHIGMGTPAVVTQPQMKRLQSTHTTFVVDSDCVARMSGATAHNAALRSLMYNWTADAIEDFDLIVPFLKQNLPFGENILTDDAVSTLRQQLQDSFNKQFKNVSSDAQFQDVILFPPGKCMHIYGGGGGEWEGSFVPCDYFDTMDVVSRMLNDHLIPKGYYPALLGYLRQLKNDYHWKMQYDVMDVDYIRAAAEKRAAAKKS